MRCCRRYRLCLTSPLKWLTRTWRIPFCVMLERGDLAVSSALFWKEMRDARWKIAVALFVSAATGISLPLMFGYLAGLLESTPLPGWVRFAAELQVAYYPFYLWANWYGKRHRPVRPGSRGHPGSRVTGGRAGPGKRRTHPHPSPLALGCLRDQGSGGGRRVYHRHHTVHSGHPGDHPGSRPSRGPGMVPGALLTGALTVHALALFFSALMADVVKAGIAAMVTSLVLSVPGYFPGGARFTLFYHMASGVTFLRSGFSQAGPGIRSCC